MEIIDLPIEIQELVEKRRTNFSGVNLEYLSSTFRWSLSPEGCEFWEEINNGNFEPFYKLYPKNQTENILNEYADDILNEYLNKLLCTKEIKIGKPICSNTIAISVNEFLNSKK